MKTSNGVLCAVVAAVFGLSVALSAPRAFADDTVYPGDTCVKLAGGPNISRNGLGGIANRDLARSLFVSCSIVNDASLQIVRGSFIETTDRNPEPTAAKDITCFLEQVRVNRADSTFTIWIDSRRTQGASNTVQTLFLPFLSSADPTFTTGLHSANYYKCNIPPAASASAVSELHNYRIVEEPLPGGRSPVTLPPDAQERQASAAVEAQEMKVKQALKTEKEDPEWSQKAVTSWTQVFQEEGIKEEIKGIQLDNIECRTTLCRLQLTPTAPPQGDAVFGQDFTKLILFAPWPVQGFGKIENPGGQASVAVLYIAREGHSLP